MDTQTLSIENKKRKSIRLEKSELSNLKKFVATFNVVVEAAISIGIHRNVLDRVLLAGSGSPATIAKIIAVLDSEATKVA